MPSVLISMRKQRPLEQRFAIVEAIQVAMVETIKIPPDDRCLRLRTFDPADFIVGPPFGEDFTLVEITLFSGRSIDAKRELYRAIVTKLGYCGIPAKDVRIILHEVPPENWGLRGGIPGSELDLGFKVEV